MSVQVFLQGELLGADSFLLAGSGVGDPDDQTLTSGRAYWASLLSEVLPRALLAELGLARILLGTSGGGRFLLVLPDEATEAASRLLKSAAQEVDSITGGAVRLLWANTENLGDWSDVRKRLNEGLTRWRATPAARVDKGFFSPFAASPPATDDDYFRNQVFSAFREAPSVSWSPEAPARISFAGGKHSWPLGGPRR